MAPCFDLRPNPQTTISSIRAPPSRGGEIEFVDNEVIEIIPAVYGSCTGNGNAREASNDADGNRLSRQS